LDIGEIHLWLLDLDRDRDEADMLWLLAPDERRRAAAFGRPDLCARFVAARAGLRIVLSGYLRCRPTDLRFETGAQGKPRLSEPRVDLEFNSSHCGPIMLLGLAIGRELGVDIERLRPLPQARRLAARYFSPGEQADLERAAGDRDTSYAESFLRLWCCKEAYLKATGEALARPLDSFEISLGRDGLAPRLLTAGGRVARRDEWHISLAPGIEGHAAALAARGPGPPPRIDLYRPSADVPAGTRHGDSGSAILPRLT
jgi:4'-phosphopantetheinyl transferase